MAIKSTCTYKVAGVAVSKQGNILGYSCNKHRFTRKGGGLHAERLLFDKYGNKIHKIYIIRINKQGSELPICACNTCSKIADKFKSRIVNI